MNFYKHHIGDYAQATAHLSFVEDAAYTRMIRKYYAEERPLPADVKAVQRLVGARTKEEREAVATVLEEFFELHEDGWHNKRCDFELAKANAQAETNRQIALEREARRKARIASNESSTNRIYSEHESCTEQVNDSLSIREPSQTPDTRHQYKNTPQPPKGAEPELVDDKSPGAVTFKAWMASLKAKGEKPIPADDPIFRYCDEVGIPHEFLTYHWHEFKLKFMAVSKRQRDWRAHFRNSVRGNWLRIWTMPNGEEIRLTTVGEQARRAIEAAEHREAA